MTADLRCDAEADMEAMAPHTDRDAAGPGEAPTGRNARSEAGEGPALGLDTQLRSLFPAGSVPRWPIRVVSVPTWGA